MNQGSAPKKGSREMADTSLDDRHRRLADMYEAVRSVTEGIASPLSPEDQTIQSMPDVSPTKWHRGHTSWFFETFVLPLALGDHVPYHPEFGYIFNSYYEAVGARHPRAERGLISRPGASEVADYRVHVDKAMTELLQCDVSEAILSLIELGINHEQQHQELMVMDIKHVLSCNPLSPAYLTGDLLPRSGAEPPPWEVRPGWIEHPGGLVEIGHSGDAFAFDNESPRYVANLVPFALSMHRVTSGEWLEFMSDGGYSRPELWLSDGWAVVQQQGWKAPLYWSNEEGSESPGGWQVFTLSGRRAVDPAEPVCHVSYYEADAFAHWTGGRLPTESEWEAVASSHRVEGNFLDPGVLHPVAAPSDEADLFGDVWEWTTSAYCPYPGFRAPEGAVGEYNGKFMVNQYVLRGGSCATPLGHTRPTYRNFFPAGARWAFSGLRLAQDR